MKIIHISDLHIDAVHSHTNYRKTACLLEHISSIEYDHLVITGDITENAELSSLKLARKLFKKFGLLNSSRASVVIGNHDIFGGVHLAEDLHRFPKKCRNTNYPKQIEIFAEAFAETSRDALPLIADSPYPFIKEFDDTVIVGLNSIAPYSYLKNPFASNGRVSDEQTEAVKQAFASGRYWQKHTVVLIHHHFCSKGINSSESRRNAWEKIETETMKLRKKKKLMKMLRQINAKIVLHGHLHENTVYENKGIRFANSGASVMNNVKNILRYNVIDTSTDSIIVTPKSLVFKKEYVTPAPYGTDAGFDASLLISPARAFSLN